MALTYEYDSEFERYMVYDASGRVRYSIVDDIAECDRWLIHDEEDPDRSMPSWSTFYNALSYCEIDLVEKAKAATLTDYT